MKVLTGASGGVAATRDYKVSVANTISTYPSLVVLSATSGITNWVVKVDSGAVRKTAIVDYSIVYTNPAGSSSTQVIG